MGLFGKLRDLGFLFQGFLICGGVWNSSGKIFVTNVRVKGVKKI